MIDNLFLHSSTTKKMADIFGDDLEDVQSDIFSNYMVFTITVLIINLIIFGMNVYLINNIIKYQEKIL